MDAFYFLTFYMIKKPQKKNPPNKNNNNKRKKTNNNIRFEKKKKEEEAKLVRNRIVTRWLTLAFIYSNQNTIASTVPTNFDSPPTAQYLPLGNLLR